MTGKLVYKFSCFGYLVYGVIPNDNLKASTNRFSKNLESLDKTLKSFWEMENVENEETSISDELRYCNEYFEKTHYRNSDGKYVVKIPFKLKFSEDMLGSSKKIASRRLNYLWLRLEHDPVTKVLYHEFLYEYESLHHMEVVDENEDDDGYYLRHHGVLRPASQTTKLRVVFDASAKTSKGNSLNDLVSKGGVIQEDLFSILIRFRKHTYAISTDIKNVPNDRNTPFSNKAAENTMERG